jgi:adenylate cyclase
MQQGHETVGSSANPDRVKEANPRNEDFAEARRLRILNAVSLMAAGTTLLYCLFYVVYDWRLFWREILFLPVASAFYLGVLPLTRLKRATTAMWFIVCVALIHLGTISWLLGAASGALSYLLIVPFVLALLMSEFDRYSVWPIAVAVGALFVVVTLAAPAGSISKLPHSMQVWIFLINSFGAIFLSCAIAVLFRWLIQKTEIELEAERQRSDRLLHAILPAAIVARLKRSEARTIAQSIPEATAIFADIVGFTKWSMETPSDEVVTELNRLFTEFDKLCLARGLEKIKTIGDAYFAVCGAPNPCEDHAARAADFALDLRALSQNWHSGSLSGLELRIVIATGPMTAGVIGRTKFAYDLWGNTVNLAARMEAHCQPGEILMSPATANALSACFAHRSKGVFDIRDQNPTELFELTGRDAYPSRNARKLVMP